MERETHKAFILYMSLTLLIVFLAQSHWVSNTCPASSTFQSILSLLFLPLALPGTMSGSLFCNVCSILGGPPLNHLCTFTVLFLKREDCSVNLPGFCLLTQFLRNFPWISKSGRIFSPMALQHLLLKTSSSHSCCMYITSFKSHSVPTL